MKNIQRNNDRLRENIKEILLLEVGLSIDVGGSLYIRELDDGNYAVGGNDGPHMEDFVMPNENQPWPCWEKVIENIDEAIDYFINYRIKYNLGTDY